MSATISLAKSATSAPRVLNDLSKPSYEQLLEMITKQQEELAAAKLSRTSALTCKVSEKGALCIYGLGRFPITLYISQFEKVAANWDSILAFVEANRSSFTRKV